MSKLNNKSMVEDKRVSKTTRLAGGKGARAANQDAEALLRRAVMACLLWEDLAYESGKANSLNIAALIPQVEPNIVASIAIEARQKQKLRHVPLFIAREMARLPAYNKYLDDVLPKIITRADQLTDFLTLYFTPKKQPLTNKVKAGLAAAFENFEEYHFAKYDRDAPIKLRDVVRLVHPKPKDPERAALYKRILDRTLTTPDTWEVALSAGKDKKQTFTDLINDRKLGGLAFLRNIRNMEEAKVDLATMQKGFASLTRSNLLPLNFLAAEQHSKKYADEIEQAMLNTLGARQKLTGHTVFVLDVSGSMNSRVSAKSEYNRIDAGIAMAILAREACERCTIYLTAGSDSAGKHKTERIKARRGFALRDQIKRMISSMGGGGIFTRQAIDFIKDDVGEPVDRIIVFSDSADCDRSGNRIPAPFGKTNYIVDVSAHARGINYKGVWTSEISGWSEYFLDYIQAAEGLTLQESQD